MKPAKGAECEICYSINASPEAYTSSMSMGSEKPAEEERRELYIALTKAKDELIITDPVTSQPTLRKAEIQTFIKDTFCLPFQAISVLTRTRD